MSFTSISVRHCRVDVKGRVAAVTAVSYLSLRQQYRCGTLRTLQNETSSLTTAAVGNFALGNDLVVHLPDLQPFIWRGKEVTAVSPKETHITKNGTECDSLDAAIEGMRVTPQLALLNSVGLADRTSFGFNVASGNSELEKTLHTQWPDVLQRLCKIALPLLLNFSDAPVPSVSSLLQACCILNETLTVVDSVSKATGFRVERIFPAALVVALWECFPRLYLYLQSLVIKRKNHFGVLLPQSSYTKTPPSESLLLMKEFKNVSRALALRTRELDDLLPPPLLVRALVHMEQCGALSDDIIGPIGTNVLRRYKTSVAPLDGPQHVATNHFLSTRFVAANVTDVDALPFQGDVALTFVCLLGRVQVPNHFQLHRLLHTILLPALVPALRAEAPDETALFEVTKCYVRYAVSGSAVLQLTSLLVPRLSHMTLEQCTRLLSAVIGGSDGGGAGAVAVGAQEEYLPLVEAILRRASSMFYNESHNASTATSSDAIIMPIVCTAGMSATVVASYICSLVSVNSANWCEAYLMAATALEKRLDELTIVEIVRVTKAIMRRNSHLPYHSLHSCLAHRLLADESALTDVRIGRVSLLAAALMLPPPKLSQNTVNVLLHGGVKGQDDTRTSNLEEQQTDSVTPLFGLDRTLAIFRRHGTKLGLCSFVAGMCVAPLAQLPLRSQNRVLTHFTSIASAIDVQWLVKGMVALTSQIPNVLDVLSVQRWFSRFTAVDVTRQLDIVHTTLLLSILSNDNYSRECALAKQAIVKQAGKLLLQDSIPLEAIGPLSFALQRANVFFPHLYSRICRVLLTNVFNAPCKHFFLAFHAAADEFTRRQHGDGSLFREVWGHLRARLMDDAASSLEAEDVVLALNAFAALDGRDRPIFAVLLQRLWTIYQGVAAEVDKGLCKATKESAPLPSGLLHWADGMLSGLTPSALAVVIDTLVYMGDGEVVDAFMPWTLIRARPVVKDLYPIDVLHLMPALLSLFTLAETFVTDSKCREGTSWLCDPINRSILHATYDACREIFLYMYGDETTTADSKALQAQRAEWTPKIHASVSRVPHRLFAELLINMCRSGVQDTAVSTAAAARITSRSYAQLQVTDLVHSVMALCFHFPPPFAPHLQQPEEETKGSATQKNSSCDDDGDCGGKGSLIDSLSCTTANSGESAKGARLSSSSSLHPPHKRFLLPALSVLWERVEELDITQMDALERCLRHFYGDKVDTDFLERLQRHRATIAGVLKKHERSEKVSAGCNEKKCLVLGSSTVSAIKEKDLSFGELTTGDLFNL